jgi:hypothetical protein
MKAQKEWSGQKTKKPEGLTPCGLSGLHRMVLVAIDQEFGGAGGI